MTLFQNSINATVRSHCNRLSLFPNKASPAIPSGYPALDQALAAGGIPRQRLSTFMGHGTSGVTTLAYALMAQAQTAQLVVVHLDTSATFDPHMAESGGVDLDLLLLVQPETWADTLEILRDLLNVPVAGLVVLDAVDERFCGPPQMQALQRTLARVAPLLPRSTWTLLLLLNDGIASIPDGPASLRLKVERQTWFETPAYPPGYRVQVQVLKDKGGPGGQQLSLDLSFERRPS